MNIFLWVSYFTILVATDCFTKLSSKKLLEGASYPVFFATKGIVACIFFLFTSKLQLGLDSVSAIFSFLYALVVLLTVYSNMKTLQAIPVAYKSVILSFVSLFVTSSLGVILFNEALSFRIVLRIIIMFAASLLIFFERKSKEGFKKFPFLPLLGCIVASIGNFLALRYYTKIPHTTSNSTFFFYTNLFTVLLSILYLLIKREKFNFSFKKYFPAFGSTICSNANSLISLLLIACTPAVIYNPFCSALAILGAVVVSFFYREKIGKLTFIAALLSIIAVVI